MSISFSGLASGLDTSSWVQSLVALKQAKVTTLEKQKEEVLLSKETLNSIKSFFSSFRSTIEKITDSKFNIASMDLFAQNLATSANLEVFTASATTDAQEGEYKIRVDQLASNTNAVSDYRYLTTIVETTTATVDSFLKDIGVKAGYIDVSTGGGGRSQLYISDSDTIGSFIEKLKGIGVDASFNNSTGVFSVNLGEDGIVDTDNTGIVDALHLEGVNEGYTSARLQIEEVTTSFELANEGSLLNELSSMVKIVGTQNVTVQNTSGDIYTIEVEEDTTLGELLTAFRDAGLYANVENGVVELSGGKITGGTYDAITALGLDEDPLTSQVTGNALTETIVEYELVTYDTRLVDDLGVKEGYMEVIDSEGDAQYLKIYSGQTIGDLMSDLANMGIYSTLDEDNGILSITGGEFNTLTDADVNALINAGTIRETEARYMQGTDLLTALYGAPAISVNQTAVSQTYAMSRALSKSYTQVISATEATTMSELGINSTQTITLHKEDGSTATFDISGATTVGGLLTNIRNNGVTATLDDGVIYLEGGWMENAAVEEALGLEHSTASSYVLGTVRTVTKTHDADSDTTLAEMGLGTSTISIKGVDGVEVGSITTNADMTIGDILSALAGYGISGTIKDGVISLDSDIGNWAEGGVLDNFGISTTTSTFTTTAGVENTSTAVVSATYTVTADSSTTLSSLGLGASTITVQGVDGAAVGTITTAANMTIGDVLTALAGYGISGTIKNGVINLDSDIGNYATGGVLTSMGVGTTTSNYTTTAGTTGTSSATITYNTTTYETTYPTLTRTLITTATIVTTDPVIGTQTITVRDTITVTEPVIGTQTVTVNHTHTSTVAEIGTKTVTVTDTVTVPVANVGSQTLLITHQHVCTEAVVGSETIYITSQVVWTSTLSKMTTINVSYNTVVDSRWTRTVTVSVDSDVVVTITGEPTIVTTPAGYTTIQPTPGTPFGDLIDFDAIHGDGGLPLLIAWSGGHYIAVTVTVDATSTMTSLWEDLREQVEDSLTGYVQISTLNSGMCISIRPVASSESVYFGIPAGLSDLFDVSSSPMTGQTVAITLKNKYVVYQPGTTTTIPGSDTLSTIPSTTSGTTVISGGTTTPISWSFSTVIQEVTGTKSITSPVVATITVDNVTTTVVTHQTVTTTVVEKTTTAPVTYTVSDTFTVNTVSYRTVTHNLSTTTVVEKTTTKTSTYTVEQTFTVEKTSTTPVTITVYGTAVYSTTTVTVTPTTSSYTADESSKMSQLGLTGTGTITVNSGGTDYIVTVNTSDTVGDMIASLAGLGIYGSMQDGKVTFKGDSEAFIKGISSGLATALKLSTSYYTTAAHTITANTASSEQKYSTTNTLTTDDTLARQGLTANGTITVVSDGTQHIVTVKTSDTVDDMLTSLAGLGIYGFVNGGKVSFKGDDEAFILGVSSNLNTVLKLGATNYTTATHTITANTASDHLTHDVTTLMSDETTLADLGITGGNIKITEKGVDYTVNIDTGTMLTIGDFRNLLTDYGFTSYIDDKGRLVVMGDGDSYLTSIAGGSNILTQLDIDDWTFGKMTQVSSHLTDTTIESDGRVNGDTLITELQDSSGNSLGITTGEYTVYSNGVRTVETIDADTTVDDFIATLGTYGMVANVATDGSIQIGAQHNSYLATSASAGANTNLISTLFADWNFVNVYTSNNIEIPEDVVVSMTRETKLADINEGVYEDGCITVVHDGIQTNISLTADDTVGTLIDELALYGFDSVINDSGQLIIKSDGDSKLQAYIGGDKASNLLDLLGIQTANWIQTNSYVNDEIQTYEIVTSHYDATDDTLLSDLDLTWNDNVLKAQGQIGVTVDGFKHSINISADETFGSLKEKFAALGLEATISNGIFMIQSGYKEFEIDTANTTSNVINDFALAFSDDLGGYSASNDNVEQTISWTEDVVLSVSNYADYDTAMSLLNISSGTLSVFRNGERATINVDSEETFGQLRARIATAFADVDIKFEDGYLKFYSNSGASVELGATTDTSNIAAICGFVNDKSGTVKSARELYRVNGDSKITTAGLFRRGDVTEGTFTVGDAVFTIDGNTSLYSIISQINASESSNATASWDSVDGKLVIKSRTTGSSFINIEAGTSNFTDIMGYTTTEVDGATGAVIAKRLDVNTQDVGDNAIFTINGTTYSSTSNTIKSDISRITGVTVNLKGVSEGEEITLTVERDKETVANAVSDIVDAYNDLIENVDKEIAKGAALDDQFTLKLVRNQIRSLMTSSLGGAGVFKNLDTVGISLNAATAGDIRTDNINILNFDKDKFLKAFDADRDALKDLLVGTETNLGIFSRVENIVEQALTSSYGYFSSAEKSYNTQIQRFDNKIKKANEAVERYRERLEAKFASMDLLISNMQNQYSSFLGV